MRHAHAAALAVAAAAAALLAGCGRPLLSAQLEVPDVSITQPGQHFDPPFLVTVANPCSYVPDVGCEVSRTIDVPFDLGKDVPLVGEKGVTVELRATGLRLDFRGGAPNGLVAAFIGVKQASGAIAPLASYAAAPAQAAPWPASIVLDVNGDLNLGDLLTDGALGLVVAFRFDGHRGVPTATSVDVTASFSIEATADYTKM